MLTIKHKYFPGNSTSIDSCPSGKVSVFNDTHKEFAEIPDQIRSDNHRKAKWLLHYDNAQGEQVRRVVHDKSICYIVNANGQTVETLK